MKHNIDHLVQLLLGYIKSPKHGGKMFNMLLGYIKVQHVARCTNKETQHAWWDNKNNDRPPVGINVNEPNHALFIPFYYPSTRFIPTFAQNSCKVKKCATWCLMQIRATRC